MPTTSPPATGLVARYRVGSVAGISAGAQISAVPDTSGNGHPDAAQATSTKAPLAKSVTQGGETFWVADFDGVDDLLSLSGSVLALAQDVPRFTIVVIGVAATVPSGVRYPMAVSIGGGTGARASLSTASSPANSIRAGGRRLDADPFRTVGGAANSMGTTWHIWIGEHFYTANSAEVIQDGTSLGIDTTWQTAGNTSNTASQAASIGASGAGGSFWDGDIAEVLLYTGTPDRATIDSYAQDTYGITVADYVPSGFAGTLARTGSGSLTLGGQPAVGGGLAVTGSGALTLSGRPAVAGSLARTGSGSLTLSGQKIVGGTLAVAGAGSLTLGGVSVGARGGLAVTGSGQLNIGTGGSSGAGSLTITGTGALILAALRIATAGVLARTGSGALTMTGRPAVTAVLTRTGSGQLLLTPGGITTRLKQWDGATWQPTVVKKWTGTAWEFAAVRVWNGTAWS